MERIKIKNHVHFVLIPTERSSIMESKYFHYGKKLSRESTIFYMKKGVILNKY